jgi:ligand-binding sensor domain-containing protein
MSRMVMRDRIGHIVLIFMGLGGLCATDSVHAQSFTWEPANGVAWGAVRSILLLSEGEFLVATGKSGTFYSADGGRTIERRASGIENATVLCLAMDSTGTIFAGAVEGVFRSGDTARSWVVAGTGIQSVRVNALLCLGGGTILAGTNGSKTYRSTDGGWQWSASDAGMTSTVIQAFAVGATGAVFAGTRGGGVFISADSGAHWSASNAGLTDLVVFSLATREPGIVLSGTRSGGLFRSTDNGADWSPVALGTPVSYVYSISGNAPGPLAMACYNAGVFLSTDDGATWEGTASSPPEIYSLALHESGTMYAGTNSGALYRSADHGESWQQLNVQLNASIVRSLCVFSDGTLLAASSTDGLCRSMDGGKIWGVLRTDMKDISVLLGGDSEVLLAGLSGGSLLRSTDGGFEWSMVDSGINSPLVLSMVRDSSGNVYASSLGGGVRRSTDGGMTWTACNAGLGSLLVRCLTVSSAGEILAGTDKGGIYRSIDQGLMWDGMGLLHAVVYSIVSDKGGGILAGTDLGIYRSGAGSWFHESNALSGIPVSRLLRLEGQSLLAGSFGWGAYRSSDDGMSWTGENEGMTNADVYDFTAQGGGTVVAATGGGVFRSVGPTSGAPLLPEATVPFFIHIEQAYPNPFNGGTVVRYSLGRESDVVVSILDLRGRVISRLAQGRLASGIHTFRWLPSGLTSGAYFCVVEANGACAVTKVLYLR